MLVRRVVCRISRVAGGGCGGMRLCRAACRWASAKTGGKRSRQRQGALWYVPLCLEWNSILAYGLPLPFLLFFFFCGRLPLSSRGSTPHHSSWKSNLFSPNSRGLMVGCWREWAVDGSGYLSPDTPQFCVTRKALLFQLSILGAWIPRPPGQTPTRCTEEHKISIMVTTK